MIGSNVQPMPTREGSTGDASTWRLADTECQVHLHMRGRGWGLREGQGPRKELSKVTRKTSVASNPRGRCPGNYTLSELRSERKCNRVEVSR
jgi:hypothetical protein